MAKEQKKAWLDLEKLLSNSQLVDLVKEMNKENEEIERKLNSKYRKARMAVASAVGLLSGGFSGFEYVEIYNELRNAQLRAVYNENIAELNHLKLEAVTNHIDPNTITESLLFTDSLKEQLISLNANPNISSLHEILDEVSADGWDISSLDDTSKLLLAGVIGVCAVVAGHEVNYILRYFEIRRHEKRMKEVLEKNKTFTEIEEEKKANKTASKSNLEQEEKQDQQKQEEQARFR